MNGEPTTIASPKDAFACGIGMIHQHFKLVDVFTAAENIVLGLDGERKLDLKAASAKILEISEKYGFSIDPNKKIYDMSVSEKQTVEIIKVLYRGADILILDEPTAVLTPQETDRLFDVMRNMKADGKALVIITHKLHEVMDVSDRVAVLRKGRYIGDVATCDTSPQKLTDMMVGHAVTLNIDRPLMEDRNLRLEVKDLDRPDSRRHQGSGPCLLRRLRRGDSGHCRHLRQRPEGAAGGHRRPAGYPARGPRHLSSPRPRRTHRRSACAGGQGR